MPWTGSSGAGRCRPVCSVRSPAPSPSRRRGTFSWRAWRSWREHPLPRPPSLRLPPPQLPPPRAAAAAARWHEIDREREREGPLFFLSTSLLLPIFPLKLQGEHALIHPCLPLPATHLPVLHRLPHPIATPFVLFRHRFSSSSFFASFCHRPGDGRCRCCDSSTPTDSPTTDVSPTTCRRVRRPAAAVGRCSCLRRRVVAAGSRHDEAQRRHQRRGQGGGRSGVLRGHLCGPPARAPSRRRRSRGVSSPCSPLGGRAVGRLPAGGGWPTLLPPARRGRRGAVRRRRAARRWLPLRRALPPAAPAGVGGARREVGDGRVQRRHRGRRHDPLLPRQVRGPRAARGAVRPRRILHRRSTAGRRRHSRPVRAGHSGGPPSRLSRWCPGQGRGMAVAAGSGGGGKRAGERGVRRVRCGAQASCLRHSVGARQTQEGLEAAAVGRRRVDGGYGCAGGQGAQKLRGEAACLSRRVLVFACVDQHDDAAGLALRRAPLRRRLRHTQRDCVAHGGRRRVVARRSHDDAVAGARAGAGALDDQVALRDKRRRRTLLEPHAVGRRRSRRHPGAQRHADAHVVRRLRRRSGRRQRRPCAALCRAAATAAAAGQRRQGDGHRVRRRAGGRVAAVDGELRQVRQRHKHVVARLHDADRQPQLAGVRARRSHHAAPPCGHRVVVGVLGVADEARHGAHAAAADAELEARQRRARVQRTRVLRLQRRVARVAEALPHCHLGHPAAQRDAVLYVSQHARRGRSRRCRHYYGEQRKRKCTAGRAKGACANVS
eukprot:Rhum_TRINITY_DN15436_c4_g1::Rhum_TRINITY_DN15436_c4_g1_i1::g.156930::m.156930